MNTLIEYAVPLWIRILFLIAIPVPVILSIRLATKSLPKYTPARISGILVAFFLLYLSYVFYMGSFGYFDRVFFPPKVLVLTTIPFATFLFFYLARTSFFRHFIEEVHLADLVRIHLFRLIGVFFLLLACYDALPAWFGLIAGTGDIIAALTSVWVALLIRDRRPGFIRITFIWNTFGLIDILFTAISANVLTKLSIDHGIMGMDTLAKFPFYLIPALAPPLIIFLHYSTYLKLKNLGLDNTAFKHRS